MYDTPSQKLRADKAVGRHVAYVPHEGVRARRRRMKQLLVGRQGWLCARCLAVHPWNIPPVLTSDGHRRCEEPTIVLPKDVR